jgi:hypothetical protein
LTTLSERFRRSERFFFCARRFEAISRTYFDRAPSADGAFYDLSLLGGRARFPALRSAMHRNSGVSAMISLFPEDVIRSAVQMACYGFAAFTAVVAFLLTPRW